MSRPVFVETNWVVDYVAPALSRSSDAAELYARAAAGELTLHVPAIALVEARKVVRSRSPGGDVNVIREYVRRERDQGRLAVPRADTVFEVLSQFEDHAKRERTSAPLRIEALASDPHLKVFGLDADMLARSVTISAGSAHGLESFDAAILSAILVAAERLMASGSSGLTFCTLDADLVPWDRHGAPRPALQQLYEAAGITVRDDFLPSPAVPHGH